MSLLSVTEELIMHPYLGKAMAEARQDDLLRQAEHHRLVRAARSGRQSWLSRRIDALRTRRFRRSAVGGLQPADPRGRPV